MNINYNDIFWGDSTIEKIEIFYDTIKLEIFNDVFCATIMVNCKNSFGITGINIREESIIENVYLSKTDKSCLSCENFLQMNGYELENHNGELKELRVLLINGESFSIICEEVTFEKIGD